jgi:hypothetical protein
MNELIEQLKPIHKKESFDCGNALLNNYLHKQARQDVDKRLAVCFVISDEATKAVIGYYTLSTSSVPLAWLPEKLVKKFPPSYADLPVTLLGRLAVDNSAKGNGLGEGLLLDALDRVLHVTITSIGSMAVVVDPIDDKAKRFYLKYGFIEIPDSGRMFITMDTIQKLLKGN